MGYLVAQEYMDSWILATAKFMFLSLESEALVPEDLGACWSSIGNQGLQSFSSGFFQPALAVFLFTLPIFFPNWLLSNHAFSSSAVIVLCRTLGCQSIYAGVMMRLGHLLMLGSQCCSETTWGMVWIIQGQGISSLNAESLLMYRILWELADILQLLCWHCCVGSGL